MSRSVEDYPEHLNPFDDNYNGVPTPEAEISRQKYNTWSASRANQVSTLPKPKSKPSLLEKPWLALKLSPQAKAVRRLSIVKTAVERFSSKKNKLTLSNSYSEGELPPRSNSVHDDFAFRIISPKLKQKLREQAFSRSISNEEQVEKDTPNIPPSSPPINGRLSSPLKSNADESLKIEDASPTSPESEKDLSSLGARPKARKKKPPPPPPPIEPAKVTNVEISNGQERTEDNHSVNSSITQDLEKDATSEEENSLTELDYHNTKLNHTND